MDRLIAAYPPLKPHVVRRRMGQPCQPTITYSDPEAVRALNTALLVADYNVSPTYSEILPADALMPPVPGRADYIHHIADVLRQSSSNNSIPTGMVILGMDIGTGANVIYPTIATSVYRWRMIASESNPTSTKSARQIVKANQRSRLIDVRQQDCNERIFDGILRPGEKIDFAMCNPPFYPSLEAFQKENARKLEGLSKGGLNKALPFDAPKQNPVEPAQTSNNFCGSGSDLWCEGGEVAFVRRMIKESKFYANRCLWFSSLVSRKINLRQIEGSLFKMGKSRSNNKQRKQIQKVLRIPIAAGHKSATLLFWTYFAEEERMAWARKRGWD